jgi:hypothetical protein
VSACTQCKRSIFWHHLNDVQDLDLSGTSMIWHMRHAPQLSGLTALTRLVLRKCMWLGDCADPWLTDW